MDQLQLIIIVISVTIVMYFIAKFEKERISINKTTYDLNGNKVSRYKYLLNNYNERLMIDFKIHIIDDTILDDNAKIRELKQELAVLDYEKLNLKIKMNQDE